MAYKGYHAPIENDTESNTDFRHVVYTAHYMQLVLMTLKPGEDIGMEVHGNDQFFRFESGTGTVVIDDSQYDVKDGDGVIVPAGAHHNVTNTGTEPMTLYTIYAGPHHKDGVQFATKEAASASREEFDGKTTE